MNEGTTERMSKWPKGGEMVSSLPFLHSTQCQHLSNACQEYPYHNDSFDFWSTGFIAKAMYDHLYHKENDSIIKCPSRRLKITPMRERAGLHPLTGPRRIVLKVGQHALSFQEITQAGTYQELRQGTKLRSKDAYQDIGNITRIHNWIMTKH